MMNDLIPSAQPKHGEWIPCEDTQLKIGDGKDQTMEDAINWINNLDEAILHSEQIADSYKDTEPNCKCAKEHRQLAEWLKELKHLRVIELKQADDLISRIEHMPHVNADRPQGRWILDRYNSQGVNRCSECGAEIKGYGKNIPFPNCPYCLAKMKIKL